MLYTSGHLEHVLHDFFDGSVWHGHINRPNGNHQVQPWYNITCISFPKLALAQPMLDFLSGTYWTSS